LWPRSPVSATAELLLYAVARLRLSACNARAPCLVG